MQPQKFLLALSQLPSMRITCQILQPDVDVQQLVFVGVNAIGQGTPTKLLAAVPSQLK